MVALKLQAATSVQGKHLVRGRGPGAHREATERLAQRGQPSKGPYSRDAPRPLTHKVQQVVPKPRFSRSTVRVAASAERSGARRALSSAARPPITHAAPPGPGRLQGYACADRPNSASESFHFIHAVVM